MQYQWRRRPFIFHSFSSTRVINHIATTPNSVAVRVLFFFLFVNDSNNWLNIIVNCCWSVALLICNIIGSTRKDDIGWLGVLILENALEAYPFMMYITSKTTQCFFKHFLHTYLWADSCQTSLSVSPLVLLRKFSCRVHNAPWWRIILLQRMSSRRSSLMI